MEPATGPGRCPNCSARWPGPLNCPRCVSWTSLDGARAAFEMDGPARAAVHALKYAGLRAVAPLMAASMRELWDGRAFDAAVPIPLHRRRRRERGFNQAEVLLRELGWPRLPGTLDRNRKTRTQVGLGAAQRRTNVSGAFAFTGDSLEGLTVVLVDDVVTTGATADECATVLHDKGARLVYAVSYARASHDGPRPPRD